MHTVVRRVRSFLEGVQWEQGVVLAVSGGPDSVALLRAFLTLSPTPPPPLVVAHLNHMLRGPDSDADEAFVRELHARLAPARPRLELCCERIDVGQRAKREAANLEQLARKVRYGWLTDVARKFQAAYVATGHTADDQAETVLNRLLRGTGLRGLRGIAARRGLSAGVELLRPLLRVRRTDVLAYLSAETQPYRTDATNRDPRLTRNRIRHQLLPLLAGEYNPAIADVLCRLAEQSDGLYREAESAGRRWLGDAERPRAGRCVVLDCAVLCAAPRNLVREVFRLVWERERWPMNAMDHRAWDRLASLAAGTIPALDLPGGLRARRRGHVVQIGPVS